MKLFRTLGLALVLSLSSAIFAANTEPDPGQICISVGRLLEQGHYSKRKLDDAMSRELLKNYLDALNYNRLYFTQKDIDAFEAKYATTLDDDILLGNASPAFEIFDVFSKRVEARIARVKSLLTK